MGSLCESRRSNYSILVHLVNICIKDNDKYGPGRLRLAKTCRVKCPCSDLIWGLKCWQEPGLRNYRLKNAIALFSLIRNECFMKMRMFPSQHLIPRIWSVQHRTCPLLQCHWTVSLSNYRLRTPARWPTRSWPFRALRLFRLSLYLLSRQQLLNHITPMKPMLRASPWAPFGLVHWQQQCSGNHGWPPQVGSDAALCGSRGGQCSCFIHCFRSCHISVRLRAIPINTYYH